MNVAHTWLAIAVLSLGCRSKPEAERPDVSALGAEPPAPAAPAAPAADAPSAAAPAAAVAGGGAVQAAVVGAPAPDFTLTDLDGKSVSLSAFRGKTVVLEWFNPGCPFVRASHTKGSLKGAAERHRKDGIVWLAINSGAAGKQGAGREVNLKARDELGMSYPILLDESGQVGRLYGAERTPHLYVIDPKGTLVYKGAIDNSPDGEGESPKSGTLVRHVDVALAELAGGKPISVRETEAYGCTVKYGS